MVMRKNDYIKEVILESLSIGGIITISLLAPNALKILKQFDKNKKHYRPSYITRKVRELEKGGYVKLIKKSSSIYVRLTTSGKDRLKQYTLKKKVSKTNSWDKIWRMVIFDIKEYRRGSRDKLRRELINSGFKKLQNSVWISPYPCEEFIILLKSDLQIGKDLLYLETRKIEGEGKIKKMFNL